MFYYHWCINTLFKSKYSDFTMWDDYEPVFFEQNAACHLLLFIHLEQYNGHMQLHLKQTQCPYVGLW